ncbi:unnamed protein product [Blepharisma stoltei]|uniref:Uncharacterized protein n=1 Tax=Blepharisma stoltei TaxID=1481888 RepID=A0AAU9IR93_9CILI|nr:unnamed protein product [Blepharisma stoltei]
MEAENKLFTVEDPEDDPSPPSDFHDTELESLRQDQNESNEKAQENLENLQKLDLDVKEVINAISNEESYHTRESFGPCQSQDHEAEKLLEDLQTNIDRRDVLKQQLRLIQDRHHNEVKQWEIISDRTREEIEILLSRNQELKECIASKDSDLERLREDLNDLRLEIKEHKQQESHFKKLVQKIEEQIIVKDQTIQEQANTIEELLKKKSMKQPRTSKGSTSPLPKGPGKYQSDYILKSKLRQANKQNTSPAVTGDIYSTPERPKSPMYSSLGSKSPKLRPQPMKQDATIVLTKMG